MHKVAMLRDSSVDHLARVHEDDARYDPRVEAPELIALEHHRLWAAAYAQDRLAIPRRAFAINELGPRSAMLEPPTR